MQHKKNHGWCKIIVTIYNTGNKVLEDWKFWLSFDEDSVNAVDDDFTNDIFMHKELNKYRKTWAYNDEKQILYKPLNNSPLIQKDSRTFECYCIPNYDSINIKIGWQLLARDFDIEGISQFEVIPEYEIDTKRIYVENIDEEREETIITDFITTMK